MEIYVKQNYGLVKNALHLYSYQDSFPQSTLCHACKENTVPMIVISDSEGLISDQRDCIEVYDGIWPHDSMSIAIYICRKCGELTALWNQA